MDDITNRYVLDMPLFGKHCQALSQMSHATDLVCLNLKVRAHHILCARPCAHSTLLLVQVVLELCHKGILVGRAAAPEKAAC